MARDNFISDNLINIREKLRQEPAVQIPDAVVSASLNANSSSETLPVELPAPAPRMQVRVPELDRERRELTGKIRRDYTLAAAELEIYEQKKQETVRFMQFLSTHQQAVENLDFNRPDISKELDRLAWEYYQHSGRWRAFSSGDAGPGASQTMPEAPVQNNRLLAVAIFVSSLIICATLLSVFL